MEHVCTHVQQKGELFKQKLCLYSNCKLYVSPLDVQPHSNPSRIQKHVGMFIFSHLNLIGFVKLSEIARSMSCDILQCLCYYLRALSMYSARPLI
jgi:hypothetical protein